jgi:hypothetical protein
LGAVVSIPSLDVGFHCLHFTNLGQKVSFLIKEHAFAGTSSLAEIDSFRLLLNRDKYVGITFRFPNSIEYPDL